MAAVQALIETYFGPVDQIYHELVSPDIHVDICLVQPAQEGDPVTLVTMGMGAHRMSVPEELADEQLERAELAIVLPPEWKLDMESFEDERWYWPLRLLKTLARLPIECDTWLGWGHTVDHEEPFAANTQLSGAILISPQQAEADSERCLLPGGETVNFYQVMPVYADEIEYKQEHGAVALLDLLAEIGFLADPYRPDVIPMEEEGKIR